MRNTHRCQPQLPNPAPQNEEWFANLCSRYSGSSLSDRLLCESLCPLRLCVILFLLFSRHSPLATSPHRSVSRTVIPSEARNLSFPLCALCVLRVLCVNSFSSFELSTFNFQPLYLRFSILCDLCVKFLLPRRGCFPRFFTVGLRHSFIVRRRLFQQLFARFHLRSRRVLCRLVSLCPRLAFARHSPLPPPAQIPHRSPAPPAPAPRTPSSSATPPGRSIQTASKIPSTSCTKSAAPSLPSVPPS